MMAFMFLFICVICLLSDLMIGIQYFRKKNNPKLWKRVLFYVQAIFLDILFPLVIIWAVRAYIDADDRVQLTLWLMWILIVTFLPKLLFAVCLLLNRLVNAVFRKKWHLFEYAGAVLGGLVIVIMLYGAIAGVTRVRVTRVEIASAKIPKAFDGYRIAHFSDLHIGNLPKGGVLLPRLVDSINNLKPDVIVNTGDLVNLKSAEITPEVFDLLTRMKAEDGVVSVLGNHDMGTYIGEGADVERRSLQDLKNKQAEMGWRLLSNEHVWVYRGVDSIAIAGVEYPAGGLHGGGSGSGVACDLATAIGGVDTDAVFSLLAAHTPTIWDSIPAVAAPDLTLSGHVHAMQVKLKIGKFQFSPAQWVYPQWSGLYERNGRWLYVNDGAGYVFFPMRVGTPAEITLYILKSLED